MKGVERTGPLALGSRIHKALERHYGFGEDLLGTWTDLVTAERQLLVDEWKDTADFDSEAELGRIMLEGYLEWSADEGIDSDYEVVSAEQRLAVPMLDGDVELMAKLDMRMRRKVDNVRLFCDFKTAAQFSDVSKTAHMNEQLLTYLMIEAMQKDEDERCDGGMFRLIKKVRRTASARPPFYDQIEVRHNIFTLRNFWTRVNAELGEIMATRKALDEGADHHAVAYPRPSRDCTWSCSFFQICTMFDDGSAVEQAIADLYEEVEPYDYYEMDKEKSSD